VPFEQTEEGQRRESGAGLGLAISRDLANAMGGHIGVDGRAGGGSRFYFTVALPVISEQQAPLPVTQRIAGYRGARKRILVVDDQSENRQLLRQMLEPIGFEVVLAMGGEDAIRMAGEQRPHLVVMDLRMPGTNGFEAAHAIKRLPGSQSIALIAASASSADLERAQTDVAFSACLRKPFQTSELLDIMQRLLGLTWQYVEAHPEDAPAHSEAAGDEFVAPPRAPLEQMLELARLGMLIRVEQMAFDLERGDSRYRIFARRIHSLCRDFDEERLLELLQDCLGAQRDALAG